MEVASKLILNKILFMNEEVSNTKSEHAKMTGKWIHRSKLGALVLVLLVGFGVMKYLKDNGPVADRELPPRVVPVVNIMEVYAGKEQLTVTTQGRVEPTRRTQAASDVRGRVVMVSPKFEAGGVFAKDEIMLEIDSADYVAAQANARSALADAQLLLVQEEARAEQAKRDWEKLGRGEASDLVLRKPQIDSAKAHIEAAQAAMEKAKRDLSRTKLRAPYYCRVAASYIDLGSYVMVGARLADLYSADAFEARVPVTLEELGYLNEDKIVGSSVSMKAVLGGDVRYWKGMVVRNEGQVDQQTMTVYLHVRIEISDEQEAYQLPPLGLFVEAEIRGRTIDQVIKIPRSALRADNTLLTVNERNELVIVKVTPVRTLAKSVLVSEGLKDGSRVIVSPMETPVPGMKLSIQE